MSVDPGNSGVTFSVKELLGKLDAKLDVVVGKLDEKVDRASFDLLSQRVTTIETENRLDKERVTTAAATLAAETERLRDQAERERVARASALEIPVRTWSLRASRAAVVGVCLSAVIVTVAVLTFFATHG